MKRSGTITIDNGHSLTTIDIVRGVFRVTDANASAAERILDLADDSPSALLQRSPLFMALTQFCLETGSDWSCVPADLVPPIGNCLDEPERRPVPSAVPDRKDRGE